MKSLLLAVSLCGALAAAAQGQAGDRVEVVGPARCYENQLVLDMLAQNTAPDALVIVIARLGAGERRAGLGRRRLHNVRTYWTELRGDGRRPETIILAEGEEVNDYGRLEFYTGGKLTAVLKLRRDADLIAANCYPEPGGAPCPPVERNLYPCRDARAVRRRSR
jgi:hypothetical protein